MYTCTMLQCQDRKEDRERQWEKDREKKLKKEREEIVCMRWKRTRERKRASVRRWEGEKRGKNEVAKGKRRKKLKKWELESLKSYSNKKRALTMIIKNAMEEENVKEKAEEDDEKEEEKYGRRKRFQNKKIPELPTLIIMTWVLIAFVQ